jgi:hypothetical protein
MPIVHSIERKHATIISVLHNFVTDISQCHMWIEGYNSQQNLHRIEETDARKCNPPLLLLLYYAPGALPLWDQSKLLQHPPEVSSVSPLLCKKLIINWSRKIKLLGHKWELWLCGPKYWIPIKSVTQIWSDYFHLVKTKPWNSVQQQCRTLSVKKAHWNLLSAICIDTPKYVNWDGLFEISFYLKVKLLPGSSSSALFRSASAPWKSPSFRFTSPLTLEQRQQISLAKF